MKFFFKPLSYIVFIFFTLTSFSIADGHTIKEMIIDLKKEIIELGETPVKRKALQNGRLYIEDLKVQKEELEKEKAKQAKIDAVKNEIIKELEKLGEKPLSEAKDIDTDEEIIALRKQLDDLKKKIKDKEEKEKKEAEAKKIAAEKEKIKNEIKKAKEELINELKKLGKDPVVTLSEIDSDEDIKALRNQLKVIKEEVEKEKERIEKEKAEKKKKIEKEKAEKKTFIGIALAFTGVAIMTQQNDIRINIGSVFLVILGGLAWAIGQVLIRKLIDIRVMQITAWVAVFAVPQLFFMSAIFESGQIEAIKNASSIVWWAVIYLGLVMTALGYLLWNNLIRNHNVGKVAPYLLLLPIFSLFGGVVFLGEEPTLLMLLGGAIILFGVGLITVPLATINNLFKR